MEFEAEWVTVSLEEKLVLMENFSLKISGMVMPYSTVTDRLTVVVVDTLIASVNDPAKANSCVTVWSDVLLKKSLAIIDWPVFGLRLLNCASPATRHIL